MIGYTDAPRAWWLTRGMARIIGVNLPQAVLDGWLGRSELAGLISRCDGCSQSAQCNDWLARSARASGLPEFCPNKAALEALAPESAPPSSTHS